MGKKGYTIFEILITLAVVAGLIFVLALNNRQFGRNAEGRGIANATLAELRAARSYAQQNQINVALAFSPQGSHFLRRFTGQEVLSEDRPVNLVSRGSGMVLWPDLSTATEGPLLPPGVDGSELAGLGYVLFTSDGQVFGNGPLLDGNSVLLTCVSYDGEITGDRVKVSQVRNARVILLSPTGSVSLSESSPAELENLPDSENLPALAELGEPPEVPTEKPVITNIEFSPRRIEDTGPVGLGRSFIEIHPLEEVGGRKEFPTLNITVSAQSPSGVPIFAWGRVTEGDSGEGFFSNIEEVELEWNGTERVGTLSWKPPYEAEGGHRFSFEIIVKDGFGNSASVEAHAGLQLEAEILPDLRLLICTSDGQVLRTNSQGGEVFNVKESGAVPSRIFWSPDGTMFYIVEPSGKLLRYASDGESPTELLTTPGGAVNYSVDPFGFYLAYTSEPTEVDLVPLINPTPDPSATPGPSPTPPPDVETDTSYKLRAVNLRNPASPLLVEEKASAAFSWSTEEPGALHFERRTLTYPDGDTEPPVVVLYHDYTNLDGTEPISNPRADSLSYPAVSGGVFSPVEPKLVARIVKEEGQPQRLLLTKLDDDGNLVSETEVLSGTTLRDLSWSMDDKTLLIVDDDQLVSVDGDSGSTSSVMSASGRSKFQLAPGENILYYLEGGVLKSRIAGVDHTLSLGLPDGVQVVDYAVTD